MNIKAKYNLRFIALTLLVQPLLLFNLAGPSPAQSSSELKEKEKEAAAAAKIKAEEAKVRAKEEQAKLKYEQERQRELEEWYKHHPRPASPPPPPPPSPPPSPTPPSPPTPPTPTPPAPPPSSGSNPLADWIATKSIFNTDISTMPVNKNSATWLNTYGTARIWPDFGTQYGGNVWGYVLNTLPDSTPLTDLSKKFTYGDQSDLGPPSPPYPTANAVGYPITSTMIVEGSKMPGGPYPNGSGGDCHIFLYQPGYNLLYEIYAVSNGAGVAPIYTSGAIWDLTSNQMRPAGWTSSDASGCAVTPILIKYEEATSPGGIHHALRFTSNWTNDASPSPDWPASHVAGVDNPIVPNMGACWRLKASYDISGFSKTNQAILQAMKTYGMYDDDNGRSGDIQGLWNLNWDDADINNLKNVTLNDGDFVDISSLQVSPTSYEAKQPTGTSSVSNTGSTGSTGSTGTTGGLSINESHHTKSKVRSIK